MLQFTPIENCVPTKVVSHIIFDDISHELHEASYLVPLEHAQHVAMIATCESKEDVSGLRNGYFERHAKSVQWLPSI